jgi:hypothetical protein
MLQASRSFRVKTRKYLKDEINEFETNSRPTNKNITDLCRGINVFKKRYQPGADVVKVERDGVFANSRIILNT